MLIPVVNPQQAGLVAASADMNAYSAAAKFLCNPPMAQALAPASAQSVTGTTVTAVNWAAPAKDNDSTWSAGSPSKFTLATQGFYEAAAHISLTNGAGAAECWFQLTTGASNPGGAGVVTSWWHCDCAGPPTGNNVLGSAGLIPVLIYPGDFLQLAIQAVGNCTTASSSGFWGDWSHRMVSL